MIQTSVNKEVPSQNGETEQRSIAFSSLAALPSNLGAIEAGMRFANKTTPFIAIIGSSGWGKSHLIESVCAFMRLQGCAVNRPIAATIYAAQSEATDENLPLLLDDVQDALKNMKTKQQVRRMLEQRVRAGRPTLLAFSDSCSQKQVCQFLPCAREWGIQTIQSPTESERDLVIRQIADSERVLLSRPVVGLVSRHLFGNGRSIQGAVHALKHVRSDWSRREYVCEACGILLPYLHGRAGWDPRDVVMDAVTQCFNDCRPADVTKEQVSAYIMLVRMGLNEHDVATCLESSPSRVYGMATSVKLQLHDPELRNCVEGCEEAVVRAIETGD